MQVRRSAAAAGLFKSPSQYIKRWSETKRLFSLQPASLGLSPRIAQSGCHPGISAMFHVLACACTRALALHMYSQALTAPSSACMCWSCGDAWYLCYLADCIWQKLVGHAAKVQCVCECVCRLVCVLWGRQSERSHGEALASWLNACLLLIRCNPYTVQGTWGHMSTDHMSWYFIIKISIVTMLWLLF